MAKFKGPDTRAMLQAGAAGSQAQLRARESGLRQEEVKSERTQEQLTRGGQMLVEAGDRMEAQKLREQKLAADMEAGKQQWDLKRRGQDIDLAKAGLEEIPGAGTPDATAQGQQAGPQGEPLAAPQQGPTDQETRPLEMDKGSGRFRATELGKQKTRMKRSKEAAELTIKMRNAETAGRNAEVAYQRAVTERGEVGAKNRAKALQGLDNAAQNSQDLLNDIGRGKITAEGLANMFADNPAMQQAAAAVDESGLPDDAEVTRIGVRLLEMRRDTAGLKYMAASGKFWSSFDESSDMGKKITQLLPGLRDTMNFGLPALPGAVPEPALRVEFQEEKAGLLSQWKGIQTDTGRSQFVRKTLARLMVESVERLGAAEINMALMQRNTRVQQMAAENQWYKEQFGPASVGGQPGDQGNVPTGTDTGGQGAGDPGAFIPSGKLGDLPKSWKQAR